VINPTEETGDKFGRIPLKKSKQSGGVGGKKIGKKFDKRSQNEYICSQIENGSYL
jgi:hypothetical protein